MTPKITEEQRQALARQPDRPIEVEDEQAKIFYVLMTRDQFQKLVYDDSDLTPDEMMAAAAHALDDPHGWGHADMDAYDTSATDSHQP